jgi:hypothetical protein
MTDFDMNHSICGMPKGCSSLSFVTIPTIPGFRAYLDFEFKNKMRFKNNNFKINIFKNAIKHLTKLYFVF